MAKQDIRRASLDDIKRMDETIPTRPKAHQPTMVTCKRDFREQAVQLCWKYRQESVDR